MPDAKSTPASARSDLIDKLRHIAQGRARLGVGAFERATGISRYDVMRSFGSFRALRRAAGLGVAQSKVDRGARLRALRDACLAAGRVIEPDTLDRIGRYRPSSYVRIWGTWHKALRALRVWATENDPDFAHLGSLPPGAPSSPRPRPRGPYYGVPLCAGPLQHAPLNELGVVLLFGALAARLGFTVERITARFPDCEAKRWTSRGWQDVRIEFEYESRNFQRHGHDPAGCDLIVCWEHNWPGAPLEVLELKREVTRVLERP